MDALLKKIVRFWKILNFKYDNMCKDLEKQMAEMLKGSQPTITTKAINILAMDLDRKFASLDEKLDTIIVVIKEGQKDTDKRFEKLQIESDDRCKSHKEEIHKKLSLVEKNIEQQKTDLSVVSFFSTHPKVLRGVAFALLLAIMYVVGTKFDITKII